MCSRLMQIRTIRRRRVLDRPHRAREYHPTDSISETFTSLSKRRTSRMYSAHLASSSLFSSKYTDIVLASFAFCCSLAKKDLTAWSDVVPFHRARLNVANTRVLSQRRTSRRFATQETGLGTRCMLCRPHCAEIHVAEHGSSMIFKSHQESWYHLNSS